MRRLDDLGLEPDAVPSPVTSSASAPASPFQKIADDVRHAVGWGPRWDFAFAGDWLVRMHDAGADYECLRGWVHVHARRDRHRNSGRQPGQPIRGTKERSLASVLGTTRLDGETDSDHLERMGRQVELAFVRRLSSVPGPRSAGTYAAIAERRNFVVRIGLAEVMGDSPFDADQVTAADLRRRYEMDLADLGPDLIADLY